METEMLFHKSYTQLNIIDSTTQAYALHDSADNQSLSAVTYRARHCELKNQLYTTICSQ